VKAGTVAISAKASRALLLGLIAVILVAMGVNAIRQLSNIVEDQGSIADSYELLADLGKLYQDVLESESAERGYAITGDRSWLRPFFDSTSRVKRDYEQVETLTKDPDQLAALNDMKPKIAERMRRLQGVIEVARTDLPASLRAIKEGGGKELMDAIRADVAKIELNERDNLKRKLVRSNARLNMVLLALIIICAVGLALIAAYALTGPLATPAVEVKADGLPCPKPGPEAVSEGHALLDTHQEDPLPMPMTDEEREQAHEDYRRNNNHGTHA
jgi:CHASE3 domain sensor protein